MVATTKFYIAAGPGSGIEIPTYSGTAVFKYIGFFGSSGNLDLITPGEAQDLTWLCNASGYVDPTLAGSGKMRNNKWTDSSGVQIDGSSRINLSTVSASGSGTLRIAITDTGNFNVRNAKLYAYDGSNVNNNPSGVYVLSYEIIPVGTSGTGDSTWALIDATNYNYFVDRTSAVGYSAAAEFNYHIGLSVRPATMSTSGYQIIALRFDAETI